MITGDKLGINSSFEQHSKIIWLDPTGVHHIPRESPGLRGGHPQSQAQADGPGQSVVSGRWSVVL